MNAGGPEIPALFLCREQNRVLSRSYFMTSKSTPAEKGRSIKNLMKKIDKYLNSAIVLTFLFAVALVIRYAG